MKLKTFNISVPGYSHIRLNKVCQDSSAACSDGSCVIAVVCDGHGGEDYVRSNVGSELAAETAKACIKEFAARIDPGEMKRRSDLLLFELEKSIISVWNGEIHRHFEQNPFTEEEMASVSERARRKYLEGRIESAYGTTLIAAAVTPDYWFCIQIGDGSCVAASAETGFEQPVPPDEKCLGNVTTSLCDSEAINSFRHCYSEKLPAAVFISSDGVANSFSDESRLENLYTAALYSFATDRFEKAENDLRDYLPRLSKQGSGDDISLAAILDMDNIGQIPAVKGFDIEKEKARVRENRQKEADRIEADRKRMEEEIACNEAERLNRLEAQRSELAEKRLRLADEQKKSAIKWTDFFAQQRRRQEEEQKRIEEEIARLDSVTKNIAEELARIEERRKRREEAERQRVAAGKTVPETPGEENGSGAAAASPEDVKDTPEAESGCGDNRDPLPKEPVDTKQQAILVCAVRAGQSGKGLHGTQRKVFQKRIQEGRCTLLRSHRLSYVRRKAGSQVEDRAGRAQAKQPVKKGHESCVCYRKGRRSGGACRVHGQQRGGDHHP